MDKSSVIPPGILYKMYSPQLSIVTGRYFYHLSCLHLTETVRTYDASSDTAWQSLTRLLVALPFVDIPRASFRQCLSLGLTRCSSDDDKAFVRTRGHVPAAKPLYFGDGG